MDAELGHTPKIEAMCYSEASQKKKLSTIHRAELPKMTIILVTTTLNVSFERCYFAVF